MVNKFQSFKNRGNPFYSEKKENFPNIIFNNTPNHFLDFHKHLGLKLRNNGQWHKPTCIDNILTSAAKIIGIMRKLKFTLSRVALWDSCSLQNSSALQQL